VKLWSLASMASGSSSSKLTQQQQGRNPLLATLRGHSDCVTDLLTSAHNSNRSRSSSRLLSCSRDCRVKLWDINSQSCVITWKMTSPCNKLLQVPDLGGCIAAVGPRAITLLDPRLDPRSSGSGGASSAGVLRVQWPSGSLACAAAYGTMLAGGGRKGVRVWDVRMPPPQQSSSSSRIGACNSSSSADRQSTSTAVAGRSSAAAAAASPSSSSSRVLFSAHMPNNQPVTSLQLSRVRLVAATSRVVLHSPASVAVWSIPDGQRLQKLSST
jgi:WD40 repeat protein